jgi:hypothetical protein
MPALRQVNAGKPARVARVGNIDNGGAARRLHVPDIESGAFHPDLSAAGTVEVGD